jgi:hypothetical protein
MEKKRKHHFVPRFYLKGWATNNQICCLRHGKIFDTALENIANIRDFYRLSPITLEGLALVWHFLKDVPPSYQPVKELVTLLTTVSNSFNNEHANTLTLELVRKEADKLLNNLEEDLYSQIEGEATKHIEALRNGDIQFWNDEENFLDFILYICIQYTRTESMMKNAMDAVDAKYHSSWGIFRVVIALVLAGRINAEYENWTLTLFVNNSTLPFITGGQPAVNLCQITGEEVKEMIVYFPISPKYAITLSRIESVKGAVRKEVVDEQDIEQYNQEIKSRSDGLLFSNEKDVLLRYV